jgi:hypothetical protein
VAAISILDLVFALLGMIALLVAIAILADGWFVLAGLASGSLG